MHLGFWLLKNGTEMQSPAMYISQTTFNLDIDKIAVSFSFFCIKIQEKISLTEAESESC